MSTVLVNEIHFKKFSYVLARSTKRIMDWVKKQTSPNFFYSRGKITKEELASHFSLSRNVVLFLTRSVLLVSAVKQQKELSLTPCWKWLQIWDATFSNYSRYSTYSSLLGFIQFCMICIPQLSPVLNVHVGFVWWILFRTVVLSDR